jgi:ferredoxin-thioredoxin reductase catalytic subunit
MNDRWYNDYAKKIGADINTNISEVINEGLENNKKNYGVRYCPCKLQKSKENICPCKEFRDTQHCHCGLFVYPELP